MLRIGDPGYPKKAIEVPSLDVTVGMAIPSRWVQARVPALAKNSCRTGAMASALT